MNENKLAFVCMLIVQVLGVGINCVRRHLDQSFVKFCHHANTIFKFQGNQSRICEESVVREANN